MSKRKVQEKEDYVFEEEDNFQDIFENDFHDINLSSSESEAENENNNEGDKIFPDVNESSTESEADSEIEDDDDSDQWEDIDSDDDEDEENEEKQEKEEEDKEDSNENNIEKTINVKQKKIRKRRRVKKNLEIILENGNENNSEDVGSSKKESKVKASTSDKKKTFNEYEQDSSDEEDLRNTIGNVPINWYDEYEHLGYGLDSLPIFKPNQGDSLDKFLDKLENPDHGRTVLDKQTGQKVRLSDEHLQLVKRLLKGKVPDAHYNMYQPFPDLYSHEVMEMPLSGRQEHKRSFVPVKSERRKVARLANLIKHGWYKRLNKPKIEEPKYYDLWKPRSEDEPPLMRITDHIPAPKVPLPGHGESYNPPAEYLISQRDQNRLTGKEKIDDDGLFRGLRRKFTSIREIPGYHKTLKERYDRLMDLYLADRKRYRKVVAEARDFLPKLPDKKDLRPYPTLEGHSFEGHRSIVRTISVHPSGKYLASGSDDHTVRVWEVSTGRCLRTFEMEEVVKKVSWNPNSKLFLLGIAMGSMVVFLNPETYLTDKVIVQQTNSIFKNEVEQGDYIAPEKIMSAVTWRKPTEIEWQKGYRVVLDHFKEVKEVVWHRQGDYFASVVPEGVHRSVMIHQLSRWRSQLPFQKNKGRVQTVAFHPKEPLFFVVTQTNIRVYNLKIQGLVKKIQANSRWVSCIAIHPGGEHFVIGGYDRRVNWFEMECTKRPHLMRFHGHAVRSINFHRKYPIFASCSDDKNVIVTHGTVYDDLWKDPLIVPLKLLNGHKMFDDLFVLDVAWHPYEPYLFTAGADGKIKLWH